jgi:molybdopterin converting factor small subunit
MDLPPCWGEDCQMKVKVKISNLLRQFSELQGEPDKDGKLLGLMQFFVNGEKLLLSEYSETLKDGDELYIFFATGGG